MTDKKDFNAEVYKNNVKNIKLSEKQKADLIKVMRDTEKQYIRMLKSKGVQDVRSTY